MRRTMEGIEEVSVSSVAEMLSSGSEKLHVLDCRFPEEFVGGHIRGAMNLWLPDAAAEYLSLVEESRGTGGESNDVIVLHCEFSTLRAPWMFRHLRKLDRLQNLDECESYIAFAVSFLPV